MLPGVQLHHQVTHFSRGSHIVTRQLEPTYALALPTGRLSSAVIDRGGRHVFVIPWRGHSLIGTSDAPFQNNPDTVAPTGEDVAALMSDINSVLPTARLAPADIKYAYAGLYPLTADAVRPDVYQGTGRYQVVDHAHHGGMDGLVSVLGAKFTTARRLAEVGADLIEAKLGRTRSTCQTAVTPLVGGDMPRLREFTDRVIRQYGAMLDAATLEHLIAGYGTEIDAVMAAAMATPDGPKRLTLERATIEAEISYAIEHEQAQRLTDVVFRRTGLGTLGAFGDAPLARCARLMANRLGWSDGRMAQEVADTSQRLLPPSPLTE
jgi:glycerol-3-phosphate dehydrogenase